MEEITLSGRLPEHKISLTPPDAYTKKKRILEILVYFFILLFTYASLRKLIDIKMFVKEVWGFALFGTKQMVQIGFVLLSSAELIVALMLAIPRTRQLGIYGAFVLMVAINILFFIMQQFSQIIPVYYGGIIPSASFITHFIFNIVVLFIALYAIILHTNSNTKHS